MTERSGRRDFFGGIAVLVLAVLALSGTPSLAQTPRPGTRPPPGRAATRTRAPARFDKAIRLQEEGAWAAAVAEYRESALLSHARRHQERGDLPPAPPALRRGARDVQAAPRSAQPPRERQGPRDTQHRAPRQPPRHPGDRGRLAGRRSSSTAATAACPSRAAPTDCRHAPRAGPTRTVISPSSATWTAQPGARSSAWRPSCRRSPPSGNSRVVETGGKKLQVLVDNLVVGETPWQGMLDVGAHSVWLRGSGSRQASAPTSTWVKRDRVVLTISARGPARLAPRRAHARRCTVLIDSVEVEGHGIWEGRLPSGPHRVDVMAEAFHLRRGQPSSRATSDGW